MRKLLLIIFCTVACAWIATCQCMRSDCRTPQQQFREAMNRVQFVTYSDSVMGYTLVFPSFFEREDEPFFGVGHVRFAYHLLTDLTLECKVLPAKALPALSKDTLYEGYMDRSRHYRYITKYRQKQGRWYVLTFCYPTDYHDAVGRILHQVKTWTADAPTDVMHSRRAAAQ